VSDDYFVSSSVADLGVVSHRNVVVRLLITKLTVCFKIDVSSFMATDKVRKNDPNSLCSVGPNAFRLCKPQYTINNLHSSWNILNGLNVILMSKFKLSGGFVVS
jgi:hypothetical protein